MSLWITSDVYQIAIAFGKNNLKSEVHLKNTLKTDGSGWWSIISMREHNFENEPISLDNCVKDAEELIEDFKNNIDNLLFLC